jgi:gluconolactonase
MVVETRDEGLHRVISSKGNLERVATGFGFTEGPVWDAANNRLIFSDMKHDHMRTWSKAAGVQTFRKPSNKANGNTFDPAGRLVSCEHATSRVVRQEADGSLTVLASQYGGKELNSPNDIVCKSDGAIYFTDPTYGRTREDVGVPREIPLPFRGVYRIAPDGTHLQHVVDDFDMPNGLCFSLDESKLYINDTARRHIRIFDVKADGSLIGGEVWAETVGEGIGWPDGMKIDTAGNIYCTGPGGIHVFDPSAKCLGVILTPEKAANMAWGDDDLCSLYVTALTSLYRLRVQIPGRLAGVYPGRGDEERVDSLWRKTI